MAPLTWRNVDAPDASGVGNMHMAASRSLSESLRGLGDVFTGIRDRRREAASADAMGILAGVSGESDVAAALERVNSTVPSRNMSPELRDAMLGLRERALGYDLTRAQIGRQGQLSRGRTGSGSGTGSSAEPSALMAALSGIVQSSAAPNQAAPIAPAQAAQEYADTPTATVPAADPMAASPVQQAAPVQTAEAAHGLRLDAGRPQLGFGGQAAGSVREALSAMPASAPAAQLSIPPQPRQVQEDAPLIGASDPMADAMENEAQRQIYGATEADISDTPQNVENALRVSMGLLRSAQMRGSNTPHTPLDFSGQLPEYAQARNVLSSANAAEALERNPELLARVQEDPIAVARELNPNAMRREAPQFIRPDASDEEDSGLSHVLNAMGQRGDAQRVVSAAIRQNGSAGDPLADIGSATLSAIFDSPNERARASADRTQAASRNAIVNSPDFLDMLIANPEMASRLGQGDTSVIDEYGRDQNQRREALAAERADISAREQERLASLGMTNQEAEPDLPELQIPDPTLPSFQQFDPNPILQGHADLLSVRGITGPQITGTTGLLDRVEAVQSAQIDENNTYLAEDTIHNLMGSMPNSEISRIIQSNPDPRTRSFLEAAFARQQALPQYQVDESRLRLPPTFNAVERALEEERRTNVDLNPGMRAFNRVSGISAENQNPNAIADAVTSILSGNPGMSAASRADITQMLLDIAEQTGQSQDVVAEVALNRVRASNFMEQYVWGDHGGGMIVDGDAILEDLAPVDTPEERLRISELNAEREQIQTRFNDVQREAQEAQRTIAELERRPNLTESGQAHLNRAREVLDRATRTADRLQAEVVSRTLSGR